MKNWKDLLGKLEPGEREPLEVRNAILDAIEALAQPLGDGRRGLLHNRIAVRLLCSDAARLDLLYAVLTAEPGLESAVASRLNAKGIAPPPGLRIEVAKVGGGTTDFKIVPSIEKPATAAPAAPARRPLRPKARLVLFSGTEFEIASDVVNIGRVPEVRGSDHRPVRRNHLYFTDQEASVSRQHAHIRYEHDTGEFRIYDDRSARGTRLFSNGQPIDVPAGRSRGELLHSGDEIYFGSVGVRFEILD